LADPDELLLPKVRLLRDGIHRKGKRFGRSEELSMGTPEPGKSRPDRTVLLGIFVVLLILTVVLIAVSFPIGFYSVFSGKLSTSFTSSTLVQPYFWIGPAIQFTPFQVSAGALFVLFTVIYAAFFLYSLREKEGPLGAIAKSFREGFGALTASPFVVVIISIGFLTFTASIVDGLVSSTGTPIGSPAGDPLALLIGFTFSPFVEELGFRVLLVGVVALILSMSRPWRTALATLWRPSRAMEGLALGSGASIIIWAATGFSAVTFGACHVVCGGSTWDIGKLPEAAYGGFVLGYLYVRYGFHVAVLAHWGVDFFGSVYAFFGQAAFGMPWNSSTTEFVGQYVVDFDMLFLFGFACFLVVVYLAVRKVARWRSGRSAGDFNAVPGEGEALR
jgi:hypothetical protein